MYNIISSLLLFLSVIRSARAGPFYHPRIGISLTTAPALLPRAGGCVAGTAWMYESDDPPSTFNPYSYYYKRMGSSSPAQAVITSLGVQSQTATQQNTVAQQTVAPSQSIATPSPKIKLQPISPSSQTSVATNAAHISSSPSSSTTPTPTTRPSRVIQVESATGASSASDILSTMRIVTSTTVVQAVNTVFITVYPSSII